MASQHAGARLADLVTGELGDDTRQRVLAHLAACPRCGAEVAERRHLGNETRIRRLTRLAEEIAEGELRLLGVHPESPRARREPQAERWASLAAAIAGPRRDMRAAWLADLAGDPESSAPLTPWQQRQYALGVIVAAVRCRLRDSFGQLWRPVDWTLETRSRRETFIGLPPALLVIYIAEHDGVHTLLTEGWGWVGGCGATMFAFVRWLQRVRGIELAERSPSADE
ncbi:anti-sigma factor family protein [Streptomyces sp. NPDC001340]